MEGCIERSGRDDVTEGQFIMEFIKITPLIFLP